MRKVITLEVMNRIAERNKKLVAKALGKKYNKKIDPYVQYAQPTKK